MSWEGIIIDRVKCHHGGLLLRHIMGSVSGFVIKCSGEPSLYIAGDTIWCSHVKNALLKYNPEIIMLNAGAAQLPIGRSITMGTSDILEVCKSAPNSRVIAVHMDSINHCLLSRLELQEYLKMMPLLKLSIPDDGELLEFL